MAFNLKKKNVELEDPIFTDDSIQFYVATYFDVDKYFGTTIGDNEDCWINFYIDYYPLSDDIVATYTVNGDYESAGVGATCDGCEMNWDLSAAEEAMFKDLISDYADYEFGSFEDMITDWKNS